jgi:hypothetical protein
MIAHHIDADRRVITTRASGKVTVGDVAGYLQRLVRDPKFNSEYNSLIVAMDEQTVPSGATLTALGPVVRVWSGRRAGVKWAFVLPNNATKALVESAIVEARLTSVITKCFLSENAAMGWLMPAELAQKP